jgi:hypothetical protein
MRTLRPIVSFWRVAYGPRTWRRVGYAVVAPPIAVACLALLLAGRVGTATRYQRHLARGMAERSADDAPGEAATPYAWRVLASSVAGLAAGLISWLVLAYLTFFLFINVGFPLGNYLAFDGRSGGALPWIGIHRIAPPPDIWASTYHSSWGGPTLAGAWAVHAGLALFTGVPLLLWALRGLTRWQSGMTRALLGAGRGRSSVDHATMAPT